MSETILVAVAWPYANGPIHHGQLGGAYLPADIFAPLPPHQGESRSHGFPAQMRTVRPSLSAPRTRTGRRAR